MWTATILLPMEISLTHVIMTYSWSWSLTPRRGAQYQLEGWEQVGEGLPRACLCIDQDSASVLAEEWITISIWAHEHPLMQEARCAHIPLISWKATKEYLNQRGYQNQSFSSVLSGPFPPTLFPSFFPPLSPSSPVHFPTTSPLFTFPFIPPFLTPGKVRFRYPFDLGTL